MRKVVRRGAPGSVYIGRPTFLGNPFVITPDHAREEVIEKYRQWFRDKLKDPAFAERVIAYCGESDLACYCAPLPCHGDVIKAWLDEGAI